MRAEDVADAGAIFEALGWPTGPEPFGPFPELFETYCRMLARVPIEARALILCLTRRYRWIRSFESERMFQTSWRLLCDHLPSRVDRILVVPLHMPDTNLPKSSHAAWYMAKGLRVALQYVAQRPVVMCDRFEDIQGKLTARSAVAFVDDFVGTGETASDVILELHEKHTLAPQQVCVIALAAQSESVRYLRSYQCEVIAAEYFGRGIRDATDISNIPDAERQMRELEVPFKLREDLCLGWKGSQALITLTRTPNNTFPIFWTNKRVAGVPWSAPFPR